MNYIFYGQFTPLTEKIQYVAVFLLQIQSSASQQISFLSAAMLLWHSPGLLPSSAFIPFMNRSMCKHLKTLNNIIATWMHAQKKLQHQTYFKTATPTQCTKANLQNQGKKGKRLHIPTISKAALPHSLYTSAFPLSHGGTPPSHASLPHHHSNRTCNISISQSR